MAESLNTLTNVSILEKYDRNQATMSYHTRSVFRGRPEYIV